MRQLRLLHLLAIPCGSRTCEIAKGIGCVSCNGPLRPGCTNDTCPASAFNPFQGVLVSEFFGVDTLYSARISSRTEISLHKQVANKFNLPDRFSVCLPSSGLGKLSIGGPSSSTISTISKSLKATPLIVNPVSTAYAVGDPSDEYFIDVKSIRVGGETLSVKNSYFSIDKDGVGGTKISTIQILQLFITPSTSLWHGLHESGCDMKIRSVQQWSHSGPVLAQTQFPGPLQGHLCRQSIWFCPEMTFTGGLVEPTQWLRLIREQHALRLWTEGRTQELQL
ncbi:UNVERIFIED_CONTAM: putative aspartic proteinase GIP2 [Sesamum calycinum]|uniref:Aspartic proteinase GIP2 n=1 Tax=Sesamum calycinum TaxID=2727403 RepID=A0AAW2JGM4_9LAMI